MKLKHMALDYFPEFKCLADKCNYTCCYQWHIDIKRPDYMKVKNLRASKEMKEKIDRSFKRVKDNSRPLYAEIILGEDEYCPFLTKEKMCGLQQECGYSILPEVCKIFPRGNCVGFSQWEEFCSTGCEQVVNLLLERPQGLRLIELQEGRKLAVKDESVEKIVLKRPSLLYYREIQMLFMGILQNRRYSVPHRLLLAGLAARDLDNVKTQQEALAFLQKGISLLEYNPTIENTLREMETDPIKGMQMAVYPIMHYAVGEGKLSSKDVYFQKAIETISENLRIKQTQEGVMLDLDIDVDCYLKAKEHFEQLEYADYLMENLLVNSMFNMQFPLKWNEEKAVWQQYLELCCQYNTLKVLITAYMMGKEDKKEVAHITTVVSRCLLHNYKFQLAILKQWQNAKVLDLSHLGYLVCC